MAYKTTLPRRSVPIGGYSNSYGDNPQDWGQAFGDTKSAEGFYTAKFLAAKAQAAENANNRNPRAITTGPQGSDDRGGRGTPWVPPSGGGGSGFNIRSQATPTTPGVSDDFKAPVYDEQKVESMAQRVAAPSVRKLRNEVQTVQGGVYDNPNVKAMTLRQALGGYGQGLESVMGGALTSATGMYNQQYQPQMQAAQLSYQARQTREQNALDREMEQKRLDAQYQNSWNAWMAKNQSA